MKRNAEWIVSGISARLADIAVWGSTFTCAFILLSAAPASAQQPLQQPSPQPPQQTYPELPAGAGRDTLIRVCGKCHSPENVTSNGQSREGWENTISKMAGYGANASDDDFTAILDYLVKNFPPGSGAAINVNKATAAQLESGLGLSSTDADAIVQYREKNGIFKSIDDLKKVPGVDAEKLDEKKARLAF